MTNLTAFSNRDFCWYFFGSVCGVNGMWIFRVLLSWSAWEETGSPSFVGLVALLSLLPVALFGPFFGALVDRGSVRRAFGLVSAALLLCPTGFVALSLAGWVTAESLLLLAAFFGVTISAYHPVRQSMGPRLVERPQVGSVVALSALNFNVGRILSPAIGGALIAHAGVLTAGMISQALFLPNLVAVFFLAPRALQRGAPKSYLSDLAEGAGAVLHNRRMMQIMLMTVLGIGPVRALNELLPLLADGSFGRGAAGLGLLTSAVGTGALLAALLQVLAGHRLVHRNSVAWMVMALGYLGTAAMVLLPWFGAVLAVASLNGFASAYLAVWLQTGLQRDLSDELRGRVMSFWMLAVTLSAAVLALSVSTATEVMGLTAAMLATLGVTGTGAILLFLRRS